MLHDDKSIEERYEDGLSHDSDFCMPVSLHYLGHEQESRSVKSLLATGSSEADDLAHHSLNTVGATRSTISPIGTASSR